MRNIRDLPIRQKMLGMTLLICGAVLCVAIAALIAFQVLSFRANFQREVSTLAEIIANNSTAAIAFNYDRDAAEQVGALKAQPNVTAATLLLPNGTVFAHYGKPETAQSLSEFPAAGTYRFFGGDLLVTQAAKVKGEQVGTLFLRADYRHSFIGLLFFFGKVIVGIMLASIILAAYLSSRLGRSITDPVLQLAQTARIVGENKDYSLRAPVSHRADEVGHLTESFNEMLNRIQTQDAALSLSQQKMEALINSIDGIVWEREPATFRFTFVSRQSAQILGYPPEAWLAAADFWEQKLDPHDATKATREVRELAAAGQPYTHEYRMTAADGRTVWIRESGTILVENGRASAVRGIFLDVTRQKLDAEQLDKLNRQLMSTSRLAGMAEVATGVLHNVGNVLNSVSVSATAVAERLRRAKVSNLKRAARLLSDHNGRLAEFLTSDPKGKILPEYLSSVAEQVANEHAGVLAKMDSLGEHIEHIKEIVAMQQNYAKVSGVYENLAVVNLVEDALRMNAAAFDRHGIELVRQYEENVPAVCVDRHKILQILINLLRNAKYAMESRGDASKRLLVQIKTPGTGRISISILDNGVGIAPEHLTRIFNHGFTTKREGHGFGLHSGANAAREMGGSLTARSEGPGRGAEFILELPAAAAARPEPLRPLQHTI
ncbi:MAG TPA: ATP-binding protein [Verrucomicrobiae bacterium]|nr:ATP-binding protein [Verrucomicrobiae bacterium]